jgi:hypothetical protein
VQLTGDRVTPHRCGQGSRRSDRVTDAGRPEHGRSELVGDGPHQQSLPRGVDGHEVGASERLADDALGLGRGEVLEAAVSRVVGVSGSDGAAGVAGRHDEFSKVFCRYAGQAPREYRRR